MTKLNGLFNGAFNEVVAVKIESCRMKAFNDEFDEVLDEEAK